MQPELIALLESRATPHLPRRRPGHGSCLTGTGPAQLGIR